MKEKVFIFDVDGVLLDLWTGMRHAYADFLQQEVSEQQWFDVLEDYLRDPLPYQEFGKWFQSSHWFAELPPLNDEMLRFPAELKQQGFDLAIVTSVDNEEEVVRVRRQNIISIYGDIFEEIICVGRQQNKAPALTKIAENYEISYFCDDILKNVIDSKECVSFPIWLENENFPFMPGRHSLSGLLTVPNVDGLKQIIKHTTTI